MRYFIRSYFLLPLVLFSAAVFAEYKELPPEPTWAYVVNFHSDSVSKCTIDQNTGAFFDCRDSGAFHLSLPGGITLATLNGTQYAYITNGNNPYIRSVTQCKVSDNGDLIDCIPGDMLGVLGTMFYKITFDTVENPRFAYLADYALAGILRCDVDPITGYFKNCDYALTDDILEGPVAVTLKSFGAHTYAYIGNVLGHPYDKVTQCTLDPISGDFDADSCVHSGGIDAWQALDITFDSKGGVDYTYVTTSGIVYKCNVNTSNGSLSACAPTGSGLSDGRAIVGTKLNGVQYMYVTNASNDTVTQCAVGNQGELNCRNSGGTGFNFPYGIAIR